MMKLDHIKPGDEVVIAPRSDWDFYNIVKVEKVTATQITAGGEKFNKRTGVRIGDSGSVYCMKLATINYFTLMSREEAERRNIERTQEQKRRAAITKIQNVTRSQLQKASTENLLLVLALLELKQD